MRQTALFQFITSHHAWCIRYVMQLKTNKAFTVFLMIESFLRKRLSSFAAGARQTGRISRVHHFDYSGGKVGVLPA